MHSSSPALIAALTFWVNEVSPRDLGVALLVSMAVLCFLIYWFLKRLRKTFIQQPTSMLSSDRANTIVRRLQVAVIVLLILLMYGLWTTRGQPIAPRITGAVIDILFTLWFVYLIRRAKRNSPAK